MVDDPEYTDDVDEWVFIAWIFCRQELFKLTTEFAVRCNMWPMSEWSPSSIHHDLLRKLASLKYRAYSHGLTGIGSNQEPSIRRARILSNTYTRSPLSTHKVFHGAHALLRPKSLPRTTDAAMIVTN